MSLEINSSFIARLETINNLNHQSLLASDLSVVKNGSCFFSWCHRFVKVIYRIFNRPQVNTNFDQSLQALQTYLDCNRIHVQNHPQLVADSLKHLHSRVKRNPDKAESVTALFKRVFPFANPIKPFDSNIQTSINHDPLFTAFNKDDWDTFHLLLDQGYNPNTRDPKGDPLLICILNSKKISSDGKQPILQSLLEHGASPYLIDNIGRDAFFHAVSSGDQAALQALLFFPYAYSETEQTNCLAVHIAISNGDAEMVEFLLANIPTLKLTSSTGWSYFQAISTAPNEDKGIKILNRIFDHHQKDKQGLNPSSKDRPNALELAYLNKRWKIAERLHEIGGQFRTDAIGLNSCENLCNLFIKNLESFKWLADRKLIDINLRTPEGASILDLLIDSDRPLSVDDLAYLIKLGIELGTNHDPYITLSLARELHKFDLADAIVQLAYNGDDPIWINPLYQEGIEVQSYSFEEINGWLRETNCYGFTPFEWAIDQENIKAAQILIPFIDFAERDQSAFSHAMRLAIRQNNREAITLMFEHGYRFEARDIEDDNRSEPIDLEFILDYTNDNFRPAIQLLQEACTADQLDQVLHLLEQNPTLLNAKYKGETPLQIVSRNNSVAVAKNLLQIGAVGHSTLGNSMIDMNLNGQIFIPSPLCLAAMYGHLGMLELICGGIDTTQSEIQEELHLCLAEAIQAKQIPVSLYLINLLTPETLSQPIIQDGVSTYPPVLHLAAANDQGILIEAVLTKVPDAVNFIYCKQCEEGFAINRTPLLSAMINAKGSPSAIQTLINHDAKLIVMPKITAELCRDWINFITENDVLKNYLLDRLQDEEAALNM